MSVTSVLIIDDHMLIRETWAKLLSFYPQFTIIGISGDGKQAIEMATDLRPNIILLDINMEPVNGFDVLKAVRKNSPGSKVIGLSMHAQPAYAKKMLRGGASGYITKNSTSDELIQAINDVVAGKQYICQEVKNLLMKQSFGDEKDVDTSLLSERELEIIELLKTGLSSKEISSKLFITPKTVEVHRHNILKKLNVKNVAALIQYIHNKGV